MPTIHNRKKAPLSIRDFKEKFAKSYGVKLVEFQDGVALVACRLNPAKQWWVDVISLTEDNPNRGILSRRINKEIPGLRTYFGARAD